MKAKPVKTFVKKEPKRAVKSSDLPGGVVHELPNDFATALQSDKAIQTVWLDITPLARNEWICWVADAKKAETRAKRIAVGLDKMRNGMRRPCCWPGCKHR